MSYQTEPMTITAFDKKGNTFEKDVTFELRPNGWVISLGWPITYYIIDVLATSTKVSDLFCIDAGGCNHCGHTVYVNRYEFMGIVTDFVKKIMTALERVRAVCTEESFLDTTNAHAILALLPSADECDPPAPDNSVNEQFIAAFSEISRRVHENACKKGFWKDGEARNDYEMIALMHSELSEATEGLREGNPPDDKVPEFTSAETEFADTIIRMMDMAHARGWRVAEALIAKAGFNTTREYMHGKSA